MRRPWRTVRHCAHGGDPRTSLSVHVRLPGDRSVAMTFDRHLRGTRPCGLPGHAIHDEGGLVVGLQEPHGTQESR